MRFRRTWRASPIVRCAVRLRTNALSGWVLYARTVRATVLTVRQLEYVDAVARTNVTLAVENIRRRSPILEDLEKKGGIRIVGAMYDLATGAVDILG